MAAIQGATWWMSSETVGKRLGLEPDRLSCWPTTAELAGWVRHDRPHMAASERGQALPHSVTLSNRGWELMRIKKKNWHQALIPSAGPSHMPQRRFSPWRT